jgi:2-polyprenyl-6-methoxyphenol hydroxylase-like FAD-dependent oxidoreductase
VNVLISGVGIAGPTLAFWLEKYGIAPTLVELAPALRTNGYVIDFWGLGYDIAEKMGLLPYIARVGYHTRELRIVDDGGRLSGFGVQVFRELTDGRYITLGRSDLSKLIYDRISGSCEIVFGDSIAGLREAGAEVHVQFEHGGERRFDLVIGADGLHSRVRKLVFGPQDRYEKDLGYRVAAFETAGYRPRDELVYILHSAPGRQVGRFALHDDRTLFLFIFASEGGPEQHEVAAQKATLRKVFEGDGWELPRILAALDSCDDLYFDRVSQIRMAAWSRGRIALVGDAAFCVSLLAGQGSALAMTAAYVLAGELATSPDQPEEAFRRYEQRLRAFIHSKQRSAERFAGGFVPRTRLGVFFRNQVIKTFRVPTIAKIAIGRDIRDQLELPEYHL